MTERILNLIDLGYDIEDATEIANQEANELIHEFNSDDEMIDDLINKGWTSPESERIVLGFNR